MSELPPRKRLAWDQAYRLVPSRFPTAGLFDRIADPADLEAVFELEAMTNPRLREEQGALRLIAPERRISGPGTTPVMAAFTHINPLGSRFAGGEEGVLYAAHGRPTAIEETIYHRQRFLAATAEPPIDIGMRCYRMSIRARLHDVRSGWPEVHAPDSYDASRSLAKALRQSGSDGIVYDSVRRQGGVCVALFYPDLVTSCRDVGHLVYRWDGERIAQVLENGRRVRRQGVSGDRS
ncbi:RES family NAD+ phosphorylase [Oleiagrimonas sp. C23AA]|uniref:RES family NAD+ phosphorylase n=1 Tax=Oleiagrimonas sp. C23AA TaxID=2719047 RepID=UPI001421A5C9|nr:RES family NAD+ phosphorylase [Oleiagrimonas sp. C23AA]NII10641.1 RES family NAD+ phosphorylase [Oleiagrimonas sp. C23AA]